MPSLNVLIVDDDKIDREALKRYLKSPSRHEYVFHQAETGAEGLGLMETQAFDCVFLDYLLPDMDGVSFLKKIYEPASDTAKAPFVMLTGQGNEAVMLDALRQGAQDYLIKDNISPDTLTIAIAKAREIFELKKSRKQAEDQLNQLQKLEAIGQLTSGVSHDFNNLLTVILGNTRLLTKRLQGDREKFSFENATEKVAAIETAARMGAELVSRLMIFTRQKPLSVNTEDINQCIGEIVQLLKRTVGSSIETQFIHGEDLWPVLVDKSQLGSALINIVANARDAMPRGGRLTIETSNVMLDESYATIRPEVIPGPYVLVAISDTGTGISAETMKHVFEPFFTTKAVGEGTGLGLSMVYGFVNQSGGHIKIYSEENHGTVFRIYLPKMRTEEEDDSLPAQVPTGTETILVCEDDDKLRDMATIMLDRLGYRTIPAQNGRIALEILKREQNIDLVFTDIVMPGGFSGIELVQEAREHRPDIKVLFTSGYTEKSLPHYNMGVEEEVISKPYHKEILAKKIRSVLDMKGEK
jgi:signal transduction histidine kinase